MTKATAISIKEALSRLTFLERRTPKTTDSEIQDAVATLSEYRDGGIYVAHYAGRSEWERHSNGDEIVLVVEGETTLILLTGGSEVANVLMEGELLVVPRSVWHRFETPKGVKVMSVTPQPTDHSIERPDVT